MRSPLSAALMWTVLAVLGHAQNAGSPQELEETLTFESAHSGAVPAGWSGGPPGTVSVDGAIVHGGRWSARLERTAASPEAFSTLTKAIPADFAGKTIEWRGFLRSEAVSDFMGLWMRQDGDAPNLGFASMQPRQIRGTNDWTEYSITLPVHPDAKQLFFGVLISGTGKVWADDLRLLVDGKPVWEAPKAVRPKTPLDLDHEFDTGSGVVISKLTPVQIENLAMLGKVWGFLKYHHPAVTTGTRHWDYDLLPGAAGGPRGARSRRGLHRVARLDRSPGPAACLRSVPHAARREPAPAPRPRLDRVGHGSGARAGRAAAHGSSKPRARQAVLRVAGAGRRQSSIRQRADVRGAEIARPRLPAAGALPASGTSSSTGFPIAINWTETGTACWPSSCHGSRWRRTRTPTSSR